MPIDLFRLFEIGQMIYLKSYLLIYLYVVIWRENLFWKGFVKYWKI